MPKDIVKDADFRPEIIGIKRIDQVASRWKHAYQQDRIIGLQDSRKYASRRPLSPNLYPEEIIRRQAAQIELLQAQADLLKKLDRIERQVLMGKITLSKMSNLNLLAS